MALSVFAALSAHEAFYISRQRGLDRPGVIVKIFEEATHDLDVPAARGRAVSLSTQIRPQLGDACLKFWLLHVILPVQKGRMMHTPNNGKVIAYKSVATRRGIGFLRIMGCF
jgi:hypothetical protein